MNVYQLMSTNERTTNEGSTNEDRQYLQGYSTNVYQAINHVNSI